MTLAPEKGIVKICSTRAKSQTEATEKSGRDKYRSLKSDELAGLIEAIINKSDNLVRTVHGNKQND